MKTDSYNKILKYDLCLGCGLCESVFGQDTIKMELSDSGFYRPRYLKTIDERKLRKICPGIKVHSTRNNSVWGNLIEVFEGWAKDAELRHKAASGGVVSSLALYLLESAKADAVLQVGVRKDHYLYNEIKVSRCKEDIIHNAQSRYAPALTLKNIKQILDESKDKYAFIGKPCDIAGVKNLIELFPEYQQRFVLFISIFCAGMPSYCASENTWKMSGRTDVPQTLKYRGDGWPGNFKATWSDGQKFELNYNESWGKILGRQLGFRCKICPDGIGMLADIAVGDSWNTKDGYPDFTEADGRCFCIVRTDNGMKMIKDAYDNGYVELIKLGTKNIKYQQKYQYDRRKLIGWRILPVQIETAFMLDFKGLAILKQAVSCNWISGLRNLIGTYRRIVNQKHGK